MLSILLLGEKIQFNRVPHSSKTKANSDAKDCYAVHNGDHFLYRLCLSQLWSDLCPNEQSKSLHNVTEEILCVFNFFGKLPAR